MSATTMSLSLAAPTKGASALRSSTVRRSTAALKPRVTTTRRTDRANTVTTKAAVEISVAYAVARCNVHSRSIGLDLFFAATVAGECLYQQGNLPADYKGRPEFSKILLPCGVLVGSFLAIQTDNSVLSPGGLLVGAAGCGLAGKMFLDRFDEIDDDGMDWPGPRVFPGTGILFSLFVFLANVEALPRILDGR